jgi:TolB-like protein
VQVKEHAEVTAANYKGKHSTVTFNDQKLGMTLVVVGTCRRRRRRRRVVSTHSTT